MRRPSSSTLFPYTTLFRSALRRPEIVDGVAGTRRGAITRRRAGTTAASYEHERGRGQTQAISEDKALHGPSMEGPIVSLRDRKSTRLNSSHPSTSYAVFCLTDATAIEFYTLSLHDALPICPASSRNRRRGRRHTARCNHSAARWHYRSQLRTRTRTRTDTGNKRG